MAVTLFFRANFGTIPVFLSLLCWVGQKSRGFTTSSHFRLLGLPTISFSVQWMVHEREAMSPNPVNQKSKEPRRRKIPLACEPCRERKSRCDGEKPICAACARRRLPIHRCVYTAENARSASSNEFSTIAEISTGHY